MRNVIYPRTAILISIILLPLSSLAAESYDNCTGFIDSVPATISTQGTWCLRGDISTGMASGAAITIASNNITIDCNDFKIGGLGAGAGTQANGLVASDRLNATVRHCNVRGFLNGVRFTGASGGGHIVEDSRFDGNTAVAVSVEGDGSVVRRNLIRDTGGSSSFPGMAAAITTFLSVDVLDNTVSGVLPSADVGGNGNSIGIFTEGNFDGSISKNRVRGLIGTGMGAATGIMNTSSGRIAITDNQVIGDSSMGSVGVSCSNGNGRTAGNIVNGFAMPISGCADDGNVAVP